MVTTNSTANPPVIIFGMDGRVDPFLALAQACKNLAKNWIASLACFVALTAFSLLLCFSVLPLDRAVPSCRAFDCFQAYYHYFLSYFFPKPYLAIISAAALFLIWIAYKKIILTSARFGGRAVSYKVIKQITLYQLCKLLVLYILLAGTYLTGALFAIVPGFVFYIRYIFSENIVLDCHSGSLLAPRLSRFLTSGNGAGIALSIAVPVILAAIACYFIWTSSLQLYTALALTVAVVSAMRIVIASILAVVYAALAEKVRCKM